MEIENLGRYEEIDILAFNRDEAMFHFFSVTNTAACYDHKGKWKDDKTIVFTYNRLQGGEQYKEEIRIELESPSVMIIHENGSLGGHTITTMEVTLRKKHKGALINYPHGKRELIE